VVTFSLKARSAIMLAGHRADAVTWHDGRTGAWLTSSAYSSSPVTFVERFLKEHPVEADFGKSCSRALREDAYLFPDAGFGEKPPAEWNSTFPHILKGASDKPDAAFYKLWEESPFSDAYLGQMAAAAVDALGLGKGRGTDFLGVSFTALDYVGHDFGPFSQEVQDLVFRLDATLGALLAHLDRVVGPGNYVVALTGDHGVAPIPEQMSREGLDAGWVSDTDVIERVEKALEPLLGPGRHVARMEYTDLHLLPETYQKLQDNPKAMQSVIEAILSVPGVARVLWGKALRERQPSGDPAIRAAQLSYFPGRSGELIIVPKPYWVLTRIVGGVPTTQAANHSSFYAYDQRVPVLLMGREIRRGEYFTAATPADIAPTLAFLCGITLARSDGRVLAEEIASPAAPPAITAAPKR
jgi:predicted AlkP superfamily pyrophosphatase or phosphodiesterase